MFRFLPLFYTGLIVLSTGFLGPVLNRESGWWAREFRYSDWRNVPKVDYSTNALVSNYYSGGNALYLRGENLERFKKDLEQRTITIGIDYYALTPISYGIISQMIDVRMVSDRLLKGGVVIIEVGKKTR